MLQKSANMNPQKNNIDLTDSFEKVPVKIFEDSTAGSAFVARQISDLIIEKKKKGEDCVLGLATGATPISLYAELVRLHKEESLSFKNVITFNLDEYYPLEREALQSYWSFMHRHLFNHIDIDPSNIHMPNGSIVISVLMNRARVFFRRPVWSHWITSHELPMRMNFKIYHKYPEWLSPWV